MAVPAAPVRVPSQCPHPRVSRQSCLSANDKGDNEVTTGAVHRSPGISLKAEENPGKSQLRDNLIKAVLPVINSNGVPYLQMRSVGSHSTSGREKKGKERNKST